MNVRRRLPVLLASAVLVLAGCTDEPEAGEEPTVEREYVVLVDDGTDQMQGEPGAYAMTARGGTTPPLAVVDVPAGFSHFGSFVIWPFDTGTEAEDDDPTQAVQYWTVHGVHRDPCRREGAAPEIGGSVDDLVEALEAQRLTRTSTPEPVTLGGHEGRYVELAPPRDVDFAECDEGYFMFWEGSPGDADHQAVPGSVERVWILDVDGARVVLAAIVGPGLAPADAEVLDDIVTSVRFDQPA